MTSSRETSSNPPTESLLTLSTFFGCSSSFCCVSRFSVEVVLRMTRGRDFSTTTGIGVGSFSSSSSFSSSLSSFASSPCFTSCSLTSSSSFISSSFSR
ncbi:hypothetical protein PENTCL1PPCAC_555 [Pristionchus entomophagus]|uniref:Uncharacterized protein n=1 Tax=Pristionchus entomophagus TaxID=358040 RepID=A0AAV5S7F0_9BILA|nr:hypothetical protein PENTCL1PPCAC_555 [Pristionchus entomophagus]